MRWGACGGRVGAGRAALQQVQSRQALSWEGVRENLNLDKKNKITMPIEQLHQHPNQLPLVAQKIWLKQTEKRKRCFGSPRRQLAKRVYTICFEVCFSLHYISSIISCWIMSIPLLCMTWFADLLFLSVINLPSYGPSFDSSLRGLLIPLLVTLPCLVLPSHLIQCPVEI